MVKLSGNNNKKLPAITFLLVFLLLAVIINGVYLIDLAQKNLGMIEFLSNLWIDHPWDPRVSDDRKLLQALVRLGTAAEGSSTSCTLGLGYTLLNDTGTALKYWEDCDGRTSQQIGRGVMAMQYNQYRLAEKWFLLAVDLDPENRDPWFFLGELYRLEKEWEQAISAYSIGASKSGFIDVGRSDIHFHLGQIYFNEISPRNLNLAWEEYSQALKIDDFRLLKKEAAFYNRGMIAIKKGDIESGAEECSRAIEINPEYYRGYLCLANAYKTLSNRILAEELFVEAIRIKPNNKQAYQLLGEMYLSQGRFSEFLSLYEQSPVFDSRDKNTTHLITELKDSFLDHE